MVKFNYETCDLMFLHFKQYLDRRRSLNNGTQQEESIDLLQETATEGPTELLD